MTWYDEHYELGLLTEEERDAAATQQRMQDYCMRERCERCGKTGATQRHIREGACMRIALLCDVCTIYAQQRADKARWDTQREGWE